jgi:hypothetical protein
MFCRPSALLCIVSVLSVPGCGKENVRLVPVKGKVTLDGKPFTKGTVMLVPQEKNAPKGMVQGKIDDTGMYEVLWDDRPGAAPGRYTVCVMPEFPKVATVGPDPKAVPTKALYSVPFNRMYIRPDTSPLSIEVVDSPQPGAYDVKLTKK